MPLTRFLITAASLVCVWGCDPKANSVTATAGEDPGDGSTSAVLPGSGTDGEPPYGGNCQETITVLSGVDAVGPTGIDPGEVLEAAQGSYAGSMQWLLEGPVLYTGSAGPFDLQLELAYVGGEVRDVDAVLVEACQHDGPCPCDDRMEVDMQMRLVSDDGVVNEIWTVAVQYYPVGNDFGQKGASIYHRFEPDETNGTLSRASFAVDDMLVLNEMVATGSFRDGAFQGSLNVDVTGVGPGGGFAGFGAVSSLGAVTELDACPGLSGFACTLAKCTTVAGRPVYRSGVDMCECSPPQDYCFAGPLEGDATPTLYTRAYDDGYEVFDEVVEFDVGVSTAPEPWRLCTDAPEVDHCACAGDGPC